ncbi:hypothetical protein TNCV_364581 [Trichonephila clavipes]|nr:hypothetical protein TNCV_364581 [Trichonephila clavipes]
MPPDRGDPYVIRDDLYVIRDAGDRYRVWYCDVLLSKRVSLFQDNTRLSFGARAAGAHYHLFSVRTLVPVRLGKQWSGYNTVNEIASEAADCRLTYAMAKCLQRR